MADSKEEKEKLKKEVAQAEQKYRDAYEKQQTYNNQLLRLESAKKAVVELKRQYKNSMDADSRIVNRKTKWQGEKYDLLKKANGPVLKDFDGKYYKSIDYILDRLNEKIAYVKGKKDHYGILINTALKTIRTVKVKIENMTN